MATVIENKLIYRYMYFRSHFLPCNLFWSENTELTDLTLGVTFFLLQREEKDKAACARFSYTRANKTSLLLCCVHSRRNTQL